ncbi:hypothetical protein BATDEDRAFT_36601 [Batrachochytrium dendrobatidis JAM81]|uniref:Clathrin light chain n=2 Tax=Batrachochytrium dendrobatidis TaxID=109871 RepID=F4NVX2_BATDJ|nr:uncharacterized protein BATDEDRAFT_36601 [Batrachochytrium dendrobatidis JAM81]EGF82379.1 hypothetical protein BATDEDRAFT_36601 [Batrachochytrium dendrobatidis JAM81]KAJ8328270.1 Clathrin light chain [Batrachochytrium dendrobatidis]KAK5673334.1 Clathrin light chain [Batrachochytrium dendrobatidis]OAJ39779.1 hypothetical protein BDEG_23602 [Batrachochytrium dendrobatidis JEL423]|eukprot:XP_006676841.1 hypothetical protein BATDEDRAFT_36601 [Batrachochytrium dendrobatidis JAM81]
MADFGDFASGIEGTTDAGSFMNDILGDSSIDPTADFLAREQAILGADTAALFGNTSPIATHNSGFASTQSVVASTTSTAAVGDLGFEILSAGSVPTPAAMAPFATVSGASLPLSSTSPTPAFGVFDQQHALGSEMDAPIFDESAFPEVSAIGVPGMSVFSTQTGASSMGLPMNVPEIEPEAVREWRERFNAVVAERDAKSKDKHDQILQQAKEHLEKLYAEYSEKKAKSISRNKDLEKTLLAARDEATSGTVWDRALKQIDSAQLTSKDKKSDDKKDKKAASANAAPKVKGPDTTRFKQLLISLRNDKKAPVI